MSPIEAVAKAIIESEPHPQWEPPADWNYIKSVPDHPLYERGMRQAKAALLALAEAELPERMSDGRSGIYPHQRDGMYRDAFRTMCRAIAQEGAE
jgi:hypothetical protein